MSIEGEGEEEEEAEGDGGAEGEVEVEDEPGTADTDFTAGSPTSANTLDETPQADLRAQIDLLQEENRRLRQEYARARRSEYRRTAIGLTLLGLVGLLAGVVFPAARTVLIALGATGVFAGLLTYYLTPDRVIPASVGERVYAAFATNGTALVSDLGLADTRIYMPTGDADDPVRLFIPQHEEYDLPSTGDLTHPFVITADERSRGASFCPTGQPLFAEFDQARTGPVQEDLGPLADQLVDALVEQFELLDGAQIDTEDDDRLTVGITGSTYGDIDRFDHPVTSFLAVGVASALDAPVSMTVDPGDDRVESVVTLHISPDDAD